jgi:DNA/RNA-binding domain of Phe-tRNA-synthetase-like protein
MLADNLRFTMSPAVPDLGVRGVYLVVSGLQNRPGDPEFETHKASVLARLAAAYGRPGFVQNDPVLAGFRDLHTRVGRSNRKYVASPEALVSRFVRTGAIPSVNLAVDIYNLVSLQTRLAIGAHDVAAIAGGVTLRLTTGEESFTPLGAPAPEPVFAGEYAYVDEANDVICRMEVIQVEKTKVGLETRDVFYIVQGNAHTPVAEVEQAAAELVALTKRFCGGQERILYLPSQGEN